MERIESALQEKDLLGGCELHYAEADPIPAIEEAAKEMSATMIVMGTHGRDGVERALLGSLFLGGHPRLITDVWVHGRHEVIAGECLRWQQALEDYVAVVKRVFG